MRLKVEANITSGLSAADKNAIGLVPILQAEVLKLRQLLKDQQMENARGRLPYSLIDGRVPSSETEVQAVRVMKQRVEELECQLADREKLIESLQSISYKQHIEESEAHSATSSMTFEEGIGAEGLRMQSGSESSQASSPINNADTTHTRRSATEQGILRSDSDDLTGKEQYSQIAINAALLAEQQKRSSLVVLADDNIDISVPRLVNLNQDPLFSECLVYYIPDGSITIGSKESDADVLLTGPDIIGKHCMLRFDESTRQVILAVSDHALVFKNGDIVPFQTITVLQHDDRIAFGRFHLFRFEAAGRSVGSSKNADSPGWECAQQELMLKNFEIMSMRRSIADHFRTSSSSSQQRQDLSQSTSRLSVDVRPQSYPSIPSPPRLPTSDHQLLLQHEHQTPLEPNKSLSPLFATRSNAASRNQLSQPNDLPSAMPRFPESTVQHVSVDSRNSLIEKPQDALPSAVVLNHETALNSSNRMASDDVNNQRVQQIVSKEKDKRVKFQLAVADVTAYQPQPLNMTLNTASTQVNEAAHTNNARQPFQRDRDDWWERRSRISQGRQAAMFSSIGQTTNHVPLISTAHYTPSALPMRIPAASIAPESLNRPLTHTSSQATAGTSSSGKGGPAEDVSPPTKVPMGTSEGPLSAFEAEAIALQRELSEMRVALQDRMKRFQKLTTGTGGTLST